MNMSNETADSDRVISFEFYCTRFPNGLRTPAFFQVMYILSSAINIPLALTAALGNLVILGALRKTKSLFPPSKALLSSLAFCDLVVGFLGQPLYIAYLLSCSQQNFEVLKSLSYTYPIGYILCFVSFQTMALISIDRFLALYLLNRYRDSVTLNKVLSAIVLTWVTGVLTCATLPKAPKVFRLVAACLIFFCILVTTCTFLHIYRKLSDRRRAELQVRCFQRRANQAAHHEQIQRFYSVSRYRQSVNSTLFVYCALLLCYAPFFGVVIFRSVTKEDITSLTMLNITQTLVLLNSSLNPVLYCWRIREVRMATKETLKNACKKPSAN